MTNGNGRSVITIFLSVIFESKGFTKILMVCLKGKIIHSCNARVSEDTSNSREALIGRTVWRCNAVR